MSDKESPNGDSSLKSSFNGEDTNHDLIISSSPVISALGLDANDSEHSPQSGAGVSVI